MVAGSYPCWCCLFFFFQAEDGIRDLTVTGVQTCALPISVLPSRGLGLRARLRAARGRDRQQLYPRPPAHPPDAVVELDRHHGDRLRATGGRTEPRLGTAREPPRRGRLPLGSTRRG